MAVQKQCQAKFQNNKKPYNLFFRVEKYFGGDLDGDFLICDDMEFNRFGHDVKTGKNVVNWLIEILDEYDDRKNKLNRMRLIVDMAKAICHSGGCVE